MYLPPISRDETLVLEPWGNTLCVPFHSHLSSFTPEVLSDQYLNLVLITAVFFPCNPAAVFESLNSMLPSFTLI